MFSRRHGVRESDGFGHRVHEVLAMFDTGEVALEAGLVTFVPVTNPLASAKKTRAGDRNLNRALRPTDAPREFEDEVANWLCPLLASHDVLPDLLYATEGPEGPLRHAHIDLERWARRFGVLKVNEAIVPSHGEASA